jgi:hypothetical protein
MRAAMPGLLASARGRSPDVEERRHVQLAVQEVNGAELVLLLLGVEGSVLSCMLGAIGTNEVL